MHRHVKRRGLAQWRAKQPRRGPSRKLDTFFVCEIKEQLQAHPSRAIAALAARHSQNKTPCPLAVRGMIAKYGQTMKNTLLSLLSLAAIVSQGQQVPTVADLVVSPEVKAGMVSFRIYAPKAEIVTLNGDWMKLGTRAPLKKSADGVWSITVGPLDPQVYLYSFNVDGMNLADPVNPRIKLRARTSASLVEVPGDALWIHKNVPHGKVEMHTHLSKTLGDVRELYVYTPPDYDANQPKKYPVLYLFHGNNDVAAGWTVTNGVTTPMGFKESALGCSKS